MMSDQKTLPTLDELKYVSDELSTLSRKGLLKIVKDEGLDINEADIERNWTPGEARAHVRLARIDKGVTPWEDEKNDQPDEGVASGALVMNVLSLRQLGHDCFVGVIAYRDIDKIVVDADVQRPEAKRRIPEIARYVVGGDGYFGAALLTAVANGGDEVTFMPTSDDGTTGTLTIEAGARIVVNDGQHRIAGIKKALHDEPTYLADRMNDGLPVVIYVDLSKGEQRQLFADVNLHAKKPPKAIGLDYDDRNHLSHFTKAVIAKSAALRGKVAFTKTKVGPKDKESYVFSALVDAHRAMFDDLDATMDDARYNARVNEAVAWWNSVDEAIGERIDAKTFAANKNAILAIARLRYDSEQVDWAKLAALDWSNDGEMSRVASNAGGSNAASKALYDELKRRVIGE